MHVTLNNSGTIVITMPEQCANGTTLVKVGQTKKNFYKSGRFNQIVIIQLKSKRVKRRLCSEEIKRYFIPYLCSQCNNQRCISRASIYFCFKYSSINSPVLCVINVKREFRVPSFSRILKNNFLRHVEYV